MYLKKLFYYSLKFSLLVGISFPTHAEPLSKKALFYRCYRKITQSFPNDQNTLVQQVASGNLDPITACLNVLNKGSLTANGGKRIGNTSDQEALNVIRTFQKLHYSWFSEKTFNEQYGRYSFTKDMLDVDGPSLFLTQALLAPNYQFKNIFTGQKNYSADRLSGSAIKGPSSNKTKAEYPPLNAPTFIELGKLIGFNQYTSKRFTHGGTKSGTLVYDENWGGGVLGSNTYMLMNVQERTIRTDGGLKVPRKWSRSVLKDFMCRELPVVRPSDAAPYVDVNSSIPFRNENMCTRCHITMDPMVGVIRNVQPRDHSFKYTVGGKETSASFGTMAKYAVSSESADLFPTSPDSSFYKRPLDGNFFYRTHSGQLVDEKLTGVESLGLVIGSLEDTYICMAKRYYQYFTGIKANVDDIGDPMYGRTLSTAELAHRNEVIGLGKNFQAHQSMRKLVEEIIRKPQFKNSNHQLGN